MLEQGDALITWQLLKEPVDRSSLPVPARKIQDHRKAYLDYEGPLSGDRGSVRRVDTGTCEILQRLPSQYVIQLQGVRLKGKFTLVRDNEDWLFRVDPGG